MGFGADGPVLQNSSDVSIPNKLVTISPSATSDTLQQLDSDTSFFRTTASDAVVAEKSAQALHERGYKGCYDFESTDYR